MPRSLSISDDFSTCTDQQEDEQCGDCKRENMAFQVNKPMGYSKEQAVVQKGKYDQAQNDDVVNWINRVIGNKVLESGKGANYLQEKLANGVLLCQFVNKISPNSVSDKVMNQKPGMNIFDMQRIAAFNQAAKKLGLSQQSSFEGGDLRDNNNMTAVLIGLYAFGRLCHDKNIANGGITARANVGHKMQDLIMDNDSDSDEDTTKKRKKKKVSRKIKQKVCDNCGGPHSSNFCDSHK